jgi:LacI family gluconate utilization system Gnt-I transcriptional repressor
MDVADAPVNLLVGFPQRDGAVLATRHLIACGYRFPAFLGARMDPRSQARLAGFTEAARAAEMFEPRRIVTTPRPSSVGMGGQLLSDLLAQAPETDAVFCNNDDLAAGALFEAQRRGLRIPERLGICGFNDLEMSRHLNPPLTTVVTPRYDVGRGAVALVCEAIAAREPEGGVSRCLDVHVAVRGTTRG